MPRSNYFSEQCKGDIFLKFEKALQQWHDFIEISFLSESLKTDYHKLIDAKHKQLQPN